jgi:hypothetical protein
VRAAAILPSRNEAATIAAVTAAIDTALAGDQAVIISADSSDDPATTERFTATRTQAARAPLTGLARGKGAQILTAARHPGITSAEVILIADTDTRNPDPAAYRALLNQVRDGAGLAIADYPRHWDEANLTSHVARPLIAAAAGIDVPQPLAGDLAVSGTTLAEAVRAYAALPGPLAACADGYGIDVFLLLTAATSGTVTSVPVTQPKLHAGSFPHLPAIFRQAVPVLLHLTTARAPAGAAAPPVYRVGSRAVEPQRLEAMLATLDSLALMPGGYDEHPWPLPVADAWHAVRSGTPAPEAAARLLPHYAHRVRTWLTRGQHATPAQLAGVLAGAHARLSAALTSEGPPP